MEVGQSNEWVRLLIPPCPSWAPTDSFVVDSAAACRAKCRQYEFDRRECAINGNSGLDPLPQPHCDSWQGRGCTHAQYNTSSGESSLKILLG